MDGQSEQSHRGKVVTMFDRVREAWARLRHAPHAEASRAGKPAGGGRAPNLFDAAAAYVAARTEDDPDGIDEAAGWVSPEALSFGVSELACRAVAALARERDEPPRTVARELLGLPTT